MARKGVNSGRVKLVGRENEERELQQARHGMRKESKRVIVLAAVFLLCLLWGLIVPVYISNDRPTGLAELLDDFATQMNAVLAFLGGDTGPVEIRLCAVLIGAAGGCALGLCGSTYQGAFNNNLAAPKTLGVMGGGAFGSLVWVLVLQDYLVPEIPGGINITAQINAEYDSWLFAHDFPGWIFSHYGAALFSVLGCFLIVGLVVLLTTLVGRGRLSSIVVILFGQVVAGTVTGIISFLRHVYTVDGGIDMADQLAEIENYVMFQNYYYEDLLTVLVPITIGIVLVLILRNRLTLLSFGDDEAQSMGVNVNRVRYIMIFLCTFLTGWAISFCGHVAFLGFISAHISRKVVGPDFKFLLPASVFVGGSLLTILLYIAQSGLPYTDANAAGQYCAIIGGISFLILAFREGRRAHGQR